MLQRAGHIVHPYDLYFEIALRPSLVVTVGSFDSRGYYQPNVIYSGIMDGWSFHPCSFDITLGSSLVEPAANFLTFKRYQILRMTEMSGHVVFVLGWAASKVWGSVWSSQVSILTPEACQQYHGRTNWPAILLLYICGIKFR
jgi:hypothetical protein